MDNWLERTALLMGEEKLDMLRRAHVLVVGVGGVGAYAAEMIARAGVGGMTIADAEGAFHVYALEWEPGKITTYVDGKEQLAVTREQMGSDHNQWPFHYAFYPILNLAWGGMWGGMNGVDDRALPVTMEVDYIRVFQKK